MALVWKPSQLRTPGRGSSWIKSRTRTRFKSVLAQQAIDLKTRKSLTGLVISPHFISLIFHHNQGCQHTQLQTHHIQVDLWLWSLRRQNIYKPLNCGKGKHLPHRNKAISSFGVIHHVGTDITRVICTSERHCFHPKHNKHLNCSIKTDQNSVSWQHAFLLSHRNAAAN